MWFLQYQDEYLEDAKGFKCKSHAVAEYITVANNLSRFGQKIEATLHIANSKDDLREYPEYVLSLGVRGGLKIERA